MQAGQSAYRIIWRSILREGRRALKLGTEVVVRSAEKPFPRLLGASPHGASTAAPIPLNVLKAKMFPQQFNSPGAPGAAFTLIGRATARS
ncbi:malate:quinone oxidoreductase [Klebsiella pneumoniae subsp. pneumoniae]|nr:malate:quinone oxidoreductase [Klebsiella pneumoniae subsp. pneumoniae]